MKNDENSEIFQLLCWVTHTDRCYDMGAMVKNDQNKKLRGVSEHSDHIRELFIFFALLSVRVREQGFILALQWHTQPCRIISILVSILANKISYNLYEKFLKKYLCVSDASIANLEKPCQPWNSCYILVNLCAKMQTLPIVYGTIR